MRILLVEDSPSDAELFRSCLALSHLAMPTLDVAERLSRALELVQAHDYDVVFLDYKLPDSLGPDSLGRLKRAAPFAPIVMLTGLDDDAVALDMVQRGARDYLVKDRINETVLWRVLRYAIARKRIEAQQRQLEARLRGAQRAESLAILAGGIAHTYNNLLTSIMGNASLALGTIAQPDPARTYLREIQKAARRAASLTNQMLTYSGHRQGDLAPVEMGEFATRMEPFLKTTQADAGTLAYDVSGKVTVQGDAAQLQQLLANLAENAWEAMAQAGVLPAEATVRVSVSAVEFVRSEEPGAPGEIGTIKPGAYARIAVSDTGCGMDGETLAKAFDPFFTTKFTGRGLGLAGVLGTVRTHGGAIRVASKAGEGTTVAVYLPAIASAEQPAEEDEGATGAPGAPGLVLVADGESLVASVVQRILERYGYTVLVATKAARVLELATERRAEVVCILLDCGLLEDAAPFLLDLRERAPGAGVLLTSDDHEAPVDLLPFAGRVGFLRKPYLPRELMAQVRAVCRHPSTAVGTDTI